MSKHKSSGEGEHKPSGKGEKKTAKKATIRVRGAVPHQPKMSRAKIRSAVAAHIGRRTKLADFRLTLKPLSLDQRDLLIDQAMGILDQIYAHLPLKRALHANDPIQSLRLLRLRHAGLDERAFQSALMDVFHGLRDLHTNYILPTGYAQKYAFLPFYVEEFYEPGGVEGNRPSVHRKRKYVVSWVSPANRVESLKEGVVVTHWNGSPIDLAVARTGNREAGSNSDARRAQGIEALTRRWLGMSLPPDEDWVTLTFTDGRKTYEARFDWEVMDASEKPTLMPNHPDPTTAMKLGLDLKRVLLDRVHKFIFDPETVHIEGEAIAHRKKAAAGAAHPPLRPETSHFPDVFPRFGTVTTPSGKFGYIRLKSFHPHSGTIDDVVEEFRRILTTLPQSGLILDVRGNGGGIVDFGERILQMLTPRKITPEPFHFLATPLALAISQGKEFENWRETIAQGLESGASFSQGFPLTDPDECNNIGQIYQGPVVLVTNALCYSTTDIFAAGFQDHEIGLVFGCHSSTGAGGANVWDYDVLQGLVVKPHNPFSDLPRGASMRVAARRSTRVGSRSGNPVEDYGVQSDVQYYLTRADVVDHNEDMIAAVAKILKSLPRQTLRLTPVPSAPRKQFSVDGTNIHRIDISLDNRPVASQDVRVFPITITLPHVAKAGSVLTANGYRKGELVVSTRLRV